jgi:putative spermidine/putrescine transport system substrate-binding protein
VNRSVRMLRLAAVLLVAGVVAAACSSSGGGTGTGKRSVPDVPMASSVGATEGKLNIIVWAGYAEKQWVKPFEQQTGCQVNAKIGNTSDQMVQLMKTGEYDGVSASGDATLRLIYGGDVAPVNTSLVPNYATVSSFLKNGSWNSVNGQMYGIPHGWGANLLMWDTKRVSGSLDSWSAVFDKASQYSGKVTAYDSPIYIADAALYLMKTQPDLGIKDPYSLTEKQLDAAISLLKQQNGSIGEYWSDYTKEVQAFESGTSVVGTTWQVIANVINDDKKTTVQTVLPKEGATGWSDTWMISSHAAHPNCMYKWMNWIVSPKANAEVAEYFGEAPAQTKACDMTSDKSFCDTYHALDADYASKIHYWTTPQAQCVDGSGTDCTDYSEWTAKWETVKG